MSQILLDIPQYGPWMVTHKGDQACRALADRHYSRQTPGAIQFCRPGRNLVLRTSLGDAVWVTWDGIRDDGKIGYECTLFRNESKHLSSDLIKWAIHATIKEWGYSKKEFLTYVNPEKIHSDNAGYCFRKAGFHPVGKSKRGLLLLRTTSYINHLTIRELLSIQRYEKYKVNAENAFRKGQMFQAYAFIRNVMREERNIKRLQNKMKKLGVIACTDFIPTITNSQLEVAGIAL